MEDTGHGFDSFDAVAVLKKPNVILRLISLVFSIVVAACLSKDAWEKTTCQFNGDPGACNYGWAVGVLSCCTVVAFLCVDFLLHRISDAQTKKMIVLADLIFFGLWSFLWFVCFCYLADSWRKTPASAVTHGWDGMKASIAFSFFSIFTCGSLAILAYIRYQQSTGDDFLAGYDDHSSGPGVQPAMRSAYSSLPTGNSYGGGPRTPPVDNSESDTKPLTSDPAYQPKEY